MTVITLIISKGGYVDTACVHNSKVMYGMNSTCACKNYCEYWAIVEFLLEHCKHNLLCCASQAYLQRSRSYQTLSHTDDLSAVALYKVCVRKVCVN